MPSSFIQTLRFRIIFSVWWFSIAEIHAIVLHQFGFDWTMAIIDSVISNSLLAFTTYVIAKSFQYYIPEKNRYRNIIALVLSLSLLWIFVSRAMVLPWAGEQEEYTRFFSHSFAIRATFGLLVNGCMALISVLWYTTREQQETEQRKMEAETLARDAELFKLRQQLQPHFLFNSLNSINALIVSQPYQARNMIQQLSDFLRGTLKKEDNQWITLEDELKHLQLYLEIEKVRFGHRLSTNIIEGEDTLSTKIPAMILQPVVENSIKFGLYDTTGDITITIETKKEAGYIEISVVNPFDAETSMPNKGTGFGLSSVQRRLYLLFARTNLLETSTTDNYFTTTIKIPQQA